MKALDRPFTQIINGATQFVIPVFQRDYTWTDSQCEQLWIDILRAARSGSGRRHFLGSVVYVSTTDSTAGFTRWLLIDGQQRITTLTLLLIALRDHIQKTGWHGSENDPTPKRLEAYFLKNGEEEGEREQKLVLRRHDQTTLRSLIEKSEPPTEASDRIRDNYDFFRDRLSDADPAEVYRGIGQLVVVDVALDRNADDPQTIFESLNSTGVDLSQADLIRNFILMRLPEKEQTRLYEAYWSKIETLFRGSESTFDAFARDYAALRTQARKQDKAGEIYYAFRRFLQDDLQKVVSIEEQLASILQFARYHAAFSLGRHASKMFAEPLARLRRLVDVPAILMMRLFECHDRLGTLSESEFVEAIGLVEAYVFRRAICGFQTRGYWQIFANLAYKIKDQSPLESLKVGLARQHENYRYPSDEEFQRELVDRDIYGLRVCAHLLERLENHNSREPTDTSAYSIEHIMPQNERLSPAWRKMLGESWREIQRTWLHRLGNLTLTGYNSTYSDRSFEQKNTIPGGFQDSSVRLNKFVREQSVWTPAEMQRRGSDLAGSSLAIWPALQIDQKLIDEANQQEMSIVAAHRKVGEVSMSSPAKGLFDKLRDHIREIDKNVVELAEAKSVSYHGPNFFLEVLPRKHRLTLLLPLDFNEVDDPHGIAEDATQWKFFLHANYEGGVSISLSEETDFAAALAIVRQAYVAAST